MDKKKLFALASFSAVAGIMVAATSAGCSSSTTVAPGDGGSTKDAKGTNPPPPVGNPPPPPPAPPPGDDGGDDGGPGTGCPSTTAVNPSDLPYNDPAPFAGAMCTEAELTAFNAAVP